MLNKKRKGFTIVELVIVIAVIAVLAAVLIPTFSNVISKANESAALQEVQNAYINALAEALGSDLKDKEVTVGDFTFKFDDATGQKATISGSAEFNSKYSAKVENGVVVLGPANGESGETGDGETPTGTESDPYTVSTEAQLKAALSKGGYIKLTNNIDLTNTGGNVSISKDVNIDLAGYTLEIIDVNEIAMDEYGDFVNNLGSDIVSVSGKLTITNTGNTGSLVIAEPNGVVDNFSLDDYYVGYEHYFCGIRVAESGTLTLENINVSGNRHYNIVNAGSVKFNNVVYDVNGGASSTFRTSEVYGLSNKGIAEIKGATFTVKRGTGFANYYAGTVEDVKISDNTSFLLNGYNAIAIENDGGRMSFIGTGVTDVRKGDDFTYDASYRGTIYVNDSASSYNSKISLKDVTVAEGMGTSVNVGALCEATIDGGTYTGAVSSAGTLKIEGGKFDGQVTCNNAEITISDGEYSAFECKGDNVVNISGGTFNDKFTFKDNETIITISGGTFYNGVTYANLATVKEVTDIIYEKSGYVMNNTYNSSGYWTIGHTNYIGPGVD